MSATAHESNETVTQNETLQMVHGVGDGSSGYSLTCDIGKEAIPSGAEAFITEDSDGSYVKAICVAHRTELDLAVPLGKATGPVRDELIRLAQAHAGSRFRPTCDDETTLRDWIDSGFDVNVPSTSH